MSENKIYEITRLMQSPDNFKDDIQEAVKIISEHFRKKYISPIEQEIKICGEQCRKTPSKEITLLEACRPFVKNTSQLDSFINIVNSLSVIQKLVPSNIKISQLNDSSVHEDGIYDIDKNCSIDRFNAESIINANPLIIVLIILIFG